MKLRKDQLTERQRLFCEHYVGAAKHNAALAARLAGYAPGCSHVTGCQLLQTPKIAEAVRGLEEVTSRDMGVSRQMFLRQLQEAAAMAKDQMDASQMVAAWRQIGLACGFYEPEVKIARPSAASQGAMARYQAMGDAELAGIAETGSA